MPHPEIRFYVALLMDGVCVAEISGPFGTREEARAWTNLFPDAEFRIMPVWKPSPKED